MFALSQKIYDITLSTTSQKYVMFTSIFPHFDS